MSEEWNLVPIKQHHGRHTNAYHDMVEDIVSQLAESGMDFKNLQKKNELGNFVREYYGCLQKNGADYIRKINENFMV